MLRTALLAALLAAVALVHVTLEYLRAAGSK